MVWNIKHLSSHSFCGSGIWEWPIYVLLTWSPWHSCNQGVTGHYIIRRLDWRGYDSMITHLGIREFVCSCTVAQRSSVTWWLWTKGFPWLLAMGLSTWQVTGLLASIRARKREREALTYTKPILSNDLL